MKVHRPAKTRVQIVRVFAILAVIAAPAAGIFGWYSQYSGRPAGGRVATTLGSSSPVQVKSSTPAGRRRLGAYTLALGAIRPPLVLRAPPSPHST